MMTDPIADMLTRIRNAALARHDRAEMPHSKLKEHVAPSSRPRATSTTCASARATAARRSPSSCATGAIAESAIDGVRRVSTPGRRVYVRHDRIDARLLGDGYLDPQHEPRRDDRPRGAQAARRRRAALRGLVSAMTTQASDAAHAGLEGGFAVACRQAPDRAAEGLSRRRSQRTGKIESRAPRARSGASSFRRTSSVKVDGARAGEPTIGGRDGARFQGLARALIGGMVKGVAEGYTKTLQLVGTGYRAEVKGQVLNLAPRLLAPHRFPLPQGIKCEIPATPREQSSS
jgi:small subunit ribosomal protein S8